MKAISTVVLLWFAAFAATCILGTFTIEHDRVQRVLHWLAGGWIGLTLAAVVFVALVGIWGGATP